MQKTFFLCLLAFLSGIQLRAQEDTEKLSLDGGTLDSQVRYLIEESNNYQQYEVIPQSWMVTFRKNVKDSVAAFRSEIYSLQGQLASEKQVISQLQNDLAANRDTLNATREAQNDMAFVGVPMEKSNYRVTMWSIITVLLLALIIFIIRFRHSHAVTRDSKQKLALLEEEFDQHRKRSLEREQKLRRELQDELNKQKNN